MNNTTLELNFYNRSLFIQLATVFTCSQAYNQSTIVKYYSRVGLTSKLLIFTSLES